MSPSVEFLRIALRHPLEAALETYSARSSKRRLKLLPRDPAPFYSADGLWTYHRHDFTEDEGFKRAYARAVKAGGHDYDIRWRVHTMLWAAQHARRLEGRFVECGTGRGFMASAICEYLDWDNRPFHLYDTFAPPGREELRPYYADGPEPVAANFAEWPGVKLIVGKIPEILLDTDSRSGVAFLHIDLNNAPGEEAALRHFWPRLQPGAPVIFDDYGFAGYEAQREAADRLGRELDFRVLTLPTGQGLVIR